MKKLLLFIAVLFGITIISEGNPVDKETAKAIGAKFLQASTAIKNVDANSLEFVTSYKMSDGNDAFYVFNTESGFVIVSADDCATPILGYSIEGQFVKDDIPIQMQDYLNDFVEEIQYGIEHETDKDEKTIRQWELVKTTGRTSENRDNKSAGPLLSTTWGQQPYYNRLCPSNENGKAITGCVATAMGQIMRYHKHPTQGEGSHSYTPVGSAGYPEQTANFGATTYEWDKMPAALTNTSGTELLTGITDEQINAVATILYHCGVSVDMMYGPSGSGGSGAFSEYVPGALQNYFKYSIEMCYTSQQYYSPNVWLSRVKANIDANRPIYYTGRDYDKNAGHAFVCDGYNNDFLHFNWGWRGSSNGNFALNALNAGSYKFNGSNYAIFNIHPDDGTVTYHTVTVAANNDDYGTVALSGTGTYTNGTKVTATATAKEGYTFWYWTEDGYVVSNDATYSFTAEYSRDLVAYFVSNETVSCDIIFDLQDNFGDGWQTNMLVLTYPNSVKELMTLESGHKDTFTRKVADGGTVNMQWIKGSFIEETQFFIKNTKNEILYENTSPSSNLNVDLTISSLSSGTVKYYFTGDNTNANWSNSANWICNTAPTATSAVSIKTNAVLDVNATIASLSIDRYDTLFISSGKTLTVTGALTQGPKSLIVIEDGGQLEQNNSGKRAMVKENVTTWTTTPSKDGWYAIASPVNAVIFDSIINLTSSTHNVYRYNEFSSTWENYLNNDNQYTTFENGRGYLYRKSDDKALRFIGTMNVANVEYQLSYTSAAGDLAGFHLIGNPYSHNIKKGAEIPNTYLEEGFYTLETNGTWKAGIDNSTEIAPCQAILVQAKNTVTNEKLVMSNTVAKSFEDNSFDYVSISVSNSSYNDVAYAVFNEGQHGLNKIEHQNEDAQMLYISHEGEHFAIAEMSKETQMFDLNFKAQTMGYYTLTIDYQGECDYIHLIDKLANEDVDMLLEDEYRFIGSPSDSEARFVVRLCDNNNGPSIGSGTDVFVYQNGNTVMVDGSGLLQVYDAMGRMVSSQQITDNHNFSAPQLPTGVYIFKLTGDTVRTQKVILQ